MFRWLTCLIVACTLGGVSTVTWAAAAQRAVAPACCCPDPRTCPCHDHPDSAADDGSHHTEYRACVEDPGSLPKTVPATLEADTEAPPLQVIGTLSFPPLQPPCAGPVNKPPVPPF